GKWVRYDGEGRMVKGEQYDAGHQGWYAFDLITGAMVKGFQAKDGYEVYYDLMNGKRHTGRFEVDDVEFTADSLGRIVSAVLNRVPYFSQSDERWSDVVIGEYGSIRQNGCSCCVGASIIDYYTGSQYSPVDIASVFYSWGHYNGQGGHGTDTGVWRMTAEQFGMTYQNYLTYEDACRQLLKGNMITACVENGIFVSGSWTHNILLMGLDQNMRTYVYDPLHPEKNGWYSVMEIQSQLSHAAMDLVDGGPWIALGKR
ncbi:MAG: hypothetical protein IKD69_05195, partial [Solobacterium sp.]|nr:hypothetical protein [Solobacterium sp.]